MSQIINPTTGQPFASLEEAVAHFQAENARLKADKAKPRKLTLKVSEKGAVSLYGMGKFPVTLYQEQWAKVLEFGNEIKGFIAENKASLKTKDQAVQA